MAKSQQPHEYKIANFCEFAKKKKKTFHKNILLLTSKMFIFQTQKKN